MGVFWKCQKKKESSQPQTGINGDGCTEDIT